MVILLTRKQAVEAANAHLRAEGTDLIALPETTTRNRRFGVWIVGYREPARPGDRLDGGGLVVTDDGGVHDLGSTPGSLFDLMEALGLWPGLEPADVPDGDTDSESLALLADLDPAEAIDLAAYRDSKRRGRGGD